MTPKKTPKYEPTWGDNGPTDEQVDTAMRVLRAEYRHSVRAMAKDIVKRIVAVGRRAGSISDAVHEDCDSCYWTTYTSAAQRVVLCSDHDWSETAEDMGMADDNVTDEQRAYFCLVHDVGEQVEAELPDDEDADEDSSEECDATEGT